MPMFSARPSAWRAAEKAEMVTGTSSTLAEARHRATLVADATGQPSAVDFQVEGDAAVVDGALVGVLQAQLDQEASLQALALQRLDAGDLNVERVAR